MGADIIYTPTGNMDTDINHIMKTLPEMEADDFLILDGFGRKGNIRLSIYKHEWGSIVFYVEPWDEEDEVLLTDWDGSQDYYPGDEEQLQQDLEWVWEDSADSFEY